FQGRVLLLTICAAGIGGTFQFGYNLSIINAPTSHIQEFTNETWRMRTGRPLPDQLVPLLWSLIVSLYPVGGLLGALLAGPMAITLGRKKSLLVNNIFMMAAATLFGFSRRAGSFEMIMLGRLLVGVSAGTVELLGGPQAWPLLLASCLVPGVLQLASLPLLPESPRYLLIDCGDSEACLAGESLTSGPQTTLDHGAHLARASGVTGILATELFDQMTRPAAYMVCGALMWTMLFLELHRLNFPGVEPGPHVDGPEVIRSTEL
ncbi:hypothetical protein E2I00_003032, partial [Balaenoptera physalus]